MSGPPNRRRTYTYDNFRPDLKNGYKSRPGRPSPDVRPVPVGGGPGLSEGV